MLAADDATQKPEGELPLIHWGTLEYQALMLERTLVTTQLVNALSDSQVVPADVRNDTETVFKRPNYDEPPPARNRTAGVGGVLLVDNDAVW